MSGPKHARKTSKGRTYQHPITGETAWSVTTLMDGGIPKPALVGWAARMVAEYAAANHRQLSNMLAAVRVSKDDQYRTVTSDPEAIAAAVDWLKGAPYRDKQRKADIGTAIHARIEARILGTPMPEPPEELRARLEHFDAFDRAFRPEWMLSEATVWNRTESYAGTLDWIARIGNTVVLGDTKSGKDVYPEVAIQLAAYQRAEFVLMPDGSEEPMPATDGACVLHLTDEGYRLVPVHITEDTYRTFLHCREMFRWQDEFSKAALGLDLMAPEGVDWTFAGSTKAAA